MFVTHMSLKFPDLRRPGTIIVAELIYKHEYDKWLCNIVLKHLKQISSANNNVNTIKWLNKGFFFTKHQTRSSLSFCECIATHIVGFPYLTNVVSGKKTLQFTRLRRRFSCHINISSFKHLQGNTRGRDGNNWRIQRQCLKNINRKFTYKHAAILYIFSYLFFPFGLTELYSFFFSPSPHLCSI